MSKRNQIARIIDPEAWSNRSPPSRSNCDRKREVMQVRSGAGESVGDV
jgi:hypothetical protein